MNSTAELAINGGTTPGLGERLLLVEDDPATRVGLTELVRTWGFIADAAADGEEALQKVTTFRPGIIISDLAMPGKSFVEYDRYDFGTRDALVRHAQAYAGGVPLSDPRISPTHAALAGLCPCLVVVSELELPRDDVQAFADKLRAAGVETDVHLARSMPHNAPALAALHPEGEASLRAITTFIRDRLGTRLPPS